MTAFRKLQKSPLRIVPFFKERLHNANKLNKNRIYKIRQERQLRF